MATRRATLRAISRRTALRRVLLLLLAVALLVVQSAGAAHAASHAASATSCLLCAVAHQPGAAAPPPIGALSAPPLSVGLAQPHELAPPWRAVLSHPARAPPAAPLPPTA